LVHIEVFKGHVPAWLLHQKCWYIFPVDRKELMTRKINKFPFSLLCNKPDFSYGKENGLQSHDWLIKPHDSATLSLVCWHLSRCPNSARNINIEPLL
jgi:hypothetical protein